MVRPAGACLAIKDTHPTSIVPGQFMSEVTFEYGPWPVSVALICHHDLTRCGVQQVIEASPHLRLLGYATNPAMAEAWLAHIKPQVVLIDADSVCDLAGTVRMVRKAVRDSKIVALCGLEAMDRVGHWSELSMDAVMLTVQPAAVLIATINELFKYRVGHSNSSVDGRPADGTRNDATSRSHSVRLLQGNWPLALTEREREVITRLAQGISNREIASLLRISPITVRHHLTNISTKLGVSGRQQLMIHGHRAGFIALEGSD